MGEVRISPIFHLLQINPLAPSLRECTVKDDANFKLSGLAWIYQVRLPPLRMDLPTSLGCH